MVDVERICCMCGDVGFPDKIFRCIKCHHRFQHSYCSNYYSEASGTPELCDWCQTEVIRGTTTSTTKHGGSSKKSSSKANRTEYSGEKLIKQHDREEGSEKAKSSSSTGAPSPKTATRRYKLLKDVMC